MYKYKCPTALFITLYGIKIMPNIAVCVCVCIRITCPCLVLVHHDHNERKSRFVRGFPRESDHATRRRTRHFERFNFKNRIRVTVLFSFVCVRGGGGGMLSSDGRHDANAKSKPLSAAPTTARTYDDDDDDGRRRFSMRSRPCARARRETEI